MIDTTVLPGQVTDVTRSMASAAVDYIGFRVRLQGQIGDMAADEVI